MIYRGAIHWADLEPVRGSEANARRPVVIVSNEANNRAAENLGRGVVTVVPITTNTRQVRSFQVLIPAGECGLSQASKAQAEQVRAIDVTRVADWVGDLPVNRLRQLEDALRLHLEL